MMVIRPIKASDLNDLYAMAKSAGAGLTTLPANEELLAQRIELSEKSFAQSIPIEQGNYMFALEDLEEERIAGVSAIEAHVGMDTVWYNYRVSQCVNSSREIGVHTINHTLYLTNDLTGSSEVCSLFLDEAYRTGEGPRRGTNGRLLSKCRFLFMREFPNLFSDKVIAEMRGYSNDKGQSPFWDALGRKFFQMDFTQADYLTGIGNKSFVAELMPKYPIYLAFLPKEAREVVGEVHDNTRPALEMLKREGFNYNGLVDIFDAGPIVECFVRNVRAVRESSMRQALVSQHPPAESEDGAYHLVSNCALEHFRCVLVPSAAVKFDTVALSHEAAKALNISMGDPVRVIPMRYSEN